MRSSSISCVLSVLVLLAARAPGTQATVTSDESGAYADTTVQKIFDAWRSRSRHTKVFRVSWRGKTVYMRHTILYRDANGEMKTAPENDQAYVYRTSIVYDAEGPRLRCEREGTEWAGTLLDFIKRKTTNAYGKDK